MQIHIHFSFLAERFSKGKVSNPQVKRQHDLTIKTSDDQNFVSTPGTPYDNSVCESFFHTLKKEAIYHHLYENPQELDVVMREYIHFYNEERPHRKLNMKTPLQFETEFFKRA